MSLRLSLRAMEDIALIHDYTTQRCGEQQAAKYVYDLGMPWKKSNRSLTAGVSTLTRLTCPIIQLTHAPGAD